MSTPSPKITDDPRGRSCGTCAHLGTDQAGTVTYVVCKCYPPIWNGSVWTWPTVDPATDWCGQFAGPVPP
jgi:hypothetical protein